MVVVLHIFHASYDPLEKAMEWATALLMRLPPPQLPLGILPKLTEDPSIPVHVQ